MVGCGAGRIGKLRQYKFVESLESGLEDGRKTLLVRNSGPNASGLLFQKTAISHIAATVSLVIRAQTPEKET